MPNRKYSGSEEHISNITLEMGQKEANRIIAEYESSGEVKLVSHELYCGLFPMEENLWNMLKGILAHAEDWAENLTSPFLYGFASTLAFWKKEQYKKNGKIIQVKISISHYYANNYGLMVDISPTAVPILNYVMNVKKEYCKEKQKKKQKK